MATSFIIALLLCDGDNCDLVRLEPTVTYPSYEACRDATSANLGHLADIAGSFHEPNRQGEMICLRDLTPQQEVAAVRPAAPPLKASPGPERQVEFKDCEHCPTMVKLAGGTYTMGSNSDPTERPPHRVTIPPFAIGKFETTEAEWQVCVTSGGCKYKPLGSAVSPEKQPITNLSWDDTIEYVRWLATTTGRPYRLPSEAEWEYAARAGTDTRYPWGTEIGVAKANCHGCGGAYEAAHPAEIAQFAPNQWGLYGMLGGVAEWTEDCWHLNYGGAPANASAWRGAPCTTHVLRGGSWINPPSDLTVTSWNFYDTSVRYIANGLRVALSVQ